ncbi:hypothetical protein L9F63_025332, partial [Diploptera punctata]
VMHHIFLCLATGVYVVFNDTDGIVSTKDGFLIFHMLFIPVVSFILPWYTNIFFSIIFIIFNHIIVVFTGTDRLTQNSAIGNHHSHPQLLSRLSILHY